MGRLLKLSKHGLAIERALELLEEVVDQHGLSGGGRGHGQAFAAGQHVDQARLADVGAADEGVFGQVAGGALADVGVADDEFCACYLHGFYLKI